MKQAPPVWKAEQLPLKAAWSVAVSTEDVRCYTQEEKSHFLVVKAVWPMHCA